MTDIAPHVTDWLRQRLPVERAASQHTCDTYAYGFQSAWVADCSASPAKPSNAVFKAGTLATSRMDWTAFWSFLRISSGPRRRRSA